MSNAAVMPKILATVMAMEGVWVAQATLRMGGQKYEFPYTFDFRRLSHGQGLYMEEGGDIPGVGTLIGANLIGYNPYDDRLHWFTVDNFGTTHDHTGELVADDRMRLIHESEKDGKEFREVIDVEWRENGEVAMKLVATLGDAVEEELQGIFVRKL